MMEHIEQVRLLQNEENLPFASGCLVLPAKFCHVVICGIMEHIEQVRFRGFCLACCELFGCLLFCHL
jgi:hypothetical protein